MTKTQRKLIWVWELKYRDNQGNPWILPVVKKVSYQSIPAIVKSIDTYGY